MAGERARLRSAALLAAAIPALVLLQSMAAAAFPLLDPSNATATPGTSTELAAPDVQDLRHQMQLTNNPFAVAPSAGWTILPRLDFEEVFNDNIRQVTKPRRADLISIVSPGVSIIGDLPRLQLKLDYAPTLEMYVPDGPQNALTQQLNATALVTAVQDWAYVDVTAFTGVQALNGIVGANGAAGTVGEAGAGTALNPNSTTLGLSKENRVQSSSLTVAPYLMHTFGDYGTGKLGFSTTASSSSRTTGFVTSPFPTGGQGSTLLATEQTGQFTTGQFLSDFQDTFSVDLSQSTTKTNQVVSAAGNVATIPTTRFTSSRQIVSDKLAYAATHWANVFVTFGHENISYSRLGVQNVNDFTWSAGVTLIPDENSALTFSYGHINGANSIQASAHYALTARTTITGSFNDSIGTQLEQFTQQLQRGVIGPNGAFVNGVTGAPLPLALTQTESGPAVFRYRTANLTIATVLDRDTINLSAQLSHQTSLTPVNQSTAQVAAVILQWTHELSPAMLLTAYGSYSVQQQSAGAICDPALSPACITTGGTTRSLVIAASLNYILTDTVTAHLRYLFSDRSSPLPNESMYQNLIVLGVTKHF